MGDDFWTTAQIAETYGASFREWFPVDASGRPAVIAVRPDLNPQAPRAVYCSQVVEAAADILVNSQKLVPVFLHRATDRWQPCGQFLPDYISRNPPELQEAIAETNRDDTHPQGPIVAIMFLEAADQ